MIHVYILRTNRNTLYIGQTNDLVKRLKQHRKHVGAKYLKAFSSFDLVYLEQVIDRSTALKREYILKRLTHEQKERLITGEKVNVNV